MPDPADMPGDKRMTKTKRSTPVVESFDGVVVYYRDTSQTSSIPCIVYEKKHGGLTEISRFSLARDMWSGFVSALSSVVEFRNTNGEEEKLDV